MQKLSHAVVTAIQKMTVEEKKHFLISIFGLRGIEVSCLTLGDVWEPGATEDRPPADPGRIIKKEFMLTGEGSFDIQKAAELLKEKYRDNKINFGK